MEELEKDILTHPRKLGYDFSNWEGKSVSHHIKKKFGVPLKVRQCQNLLHKIDLTLQRPRYEFPVADPREQIEFAKQFKKN
jgi:transposase